MLDVGAGRHIAHIKEFVESQGFAYAPYDPYNLPKATNNTSLRLKPAVVICSNVFNVIKDDCAMLCGFLDKNNLLINSQHSLKEFEINSSIHTEIHSSVRDIENQIKKENLNGKVVYIDVTEDLISKYLDDDSFEIAHFVFPINFAKDSKLKNIRQKLNEDLNIEKYIGLCNIDKGCNLTYRYDKTRASITKQFIIMQNIM